MHVARNVRTAAVYLRLRRHKEAKVRAWAAASSACTAASCAAAVCSVNASAASAAASAASAWEFRPAICSSRNVIRSAAASAHACVSPAHPQSHYSSTEQISLFQSA